MRGISKSFGDVRALVDVDFELRHEEVHALAGENGAGKTTLMNVLAGLYQPDAGEIRVDGRPVRIGSPRAAIELGIGMVHQHFELVAPFTAYENIVLGAEGGGWRNGRSGRRAEIARLMEHYGLSVDLDAQIRDLPIGVQQKIEILKAVSRGARVLILDEPTTHLTLQEVDRLFETVRQLVAGGLTVVLITHKLREIRGIGDRVTVMRRGRVAATVEGAGLTEERLVGLLMGTDGAATARTNTPGEPSLTLEALRAAANERRQDAGESLLRLEGVSARGSVGDLVLADCSLDLRPGEIVGVAGVAGNGQRDLGDVIAGIQPIVTGRLFVGGRDLTDATVRDRLLAGIAYIPEDRLREGILPHLSLGETLVLGPHHALFGTSVVFDERRVDALARAVIAEYDVAAPDEHVPAARLSGGNIQKVLIARAMLVLQQARVGVLVAMNPTRGLDIGATRSVHRRFEGLRERGDAVLLVSEDLDELRRLSDHIVVMYRGRIVGTFQRPAFDPYQIGALMTGMATGTDGGPPNETGGGTGGAETTRPGRDSR